MHDVGQKVRRLKIRFEPIRDVTLDVGSVHFAQESFLLDIRVPNLTKHPKVTLLDEGDSFNSLSLDTVLSAITGTVARSICLD